MNGRPPKQLPVAPLLEALSAAGIDRDCEIARATELHPRTIRRARNTGLLTTAAADRAAIRAFNVHPSHIWGDAWLDQPNNSDKAE